MEYISFTLQDSTLQLYLMCTAVCAFFFAVRMVKVALYSK